MWGVSVPKKNWKVREEFIVFIDGDASLLCQVRAQREGTAGEVILDGWVINGNWVFTVNTKTGRAVILNSPRGDRHVQGWRVVPLSNIPGVPKEDYNMVLDYVKASGYRVGQSTPLKLYALGLWLRVVAVARRFKEASRAFYVVLAGRGIVKDVPLRDSDSAGDDDSPF